MKIILTRKPKSKIIMKKIHIKRDLTKRRKFV